MGVRFYSEFYFMRKNTQPEISYASRDIKNVLRMSYPTLKSLYTKECKYFYHCRHCIGLSEYISIITKKNQKRKRVRRFGLKLDDLLEKIYIHILNIIEDRCDVHCWCTFKVTMCDDSKPYDYIP